MGYQENRSRFGETREHDRYGDRDYGRSSPGRGDYYGRSNYGSDRDRYRDDDDRGFFDRAGDEVRSWFGDEDAQRRRERDDRDYSDDYIRDSGSTMSRYGQDRYGEQRYGRPASYNYGSGQQQSQGHEPGYTDWRRRQMDQLDRDYHEYRQQNQSRFDNEFSTWRSGRQSQRDSLQKVDEHMEVVGSDGEKLGTVDKVRGDRIILAKNDTQAGGHHHSIPSSWIQSVDDKVTLAKSCDDAKRAWRDEERDTSYGSTNTAGSDGPHNLNRAFSGTY